jgi:hypothetical protein
MNQFEELCEADYVLKVAISFILVALRKVPGEKLSYRIPLDTYDI